MQGATKVVETTTNDYQEAGKTLTREALRKIPAGCLVCQSTDQLLFLLHLSVKSGDTISLLICHECAKQLTAFELCELVQEKINGSKQTSLH